MTTRHSRDALVIAISYNKKTFTRLKNANKAALMFNMATKKVGIKHMKSNYKTISKELREFKEYSTTNLESY